MSPIGIGLRLSRQRIMQDSGLPSFLLFSPSLFIGKFPTASWPGLRGRFGRLETPMDWIHGACHYQRSLVMELTGAVLPNATWSVIQLLLPSRLLAAIVLSISLLYYISNNITFPDYGNTYEARCSRWKSTYCYSLQMIASRPACGLSEG